ncbi:MAG: hypothetical protein Q9172_004351 [Xanthocarpia lactea]
MDDDSSSKPTQINTHPPIFDKLNPKTRGYLAQTIKARQEEEQESHNMADERTYKLAAIKMVTPSKEHLEEHYKDLSDKPFFKGLVTYMLSGPIVAMVWEGRDAVKTGRTLLGATNPLQSAPGTIRGDYAIDVGRNVCHGSDSVETAKNEIALWFAQARPRVFGTDDLAPPLSGFRLPGRVQSTKKLQSAAALCASIVYRILEAMEVELGESEMLLGPVETCPDAASPQIEAASKDVAPSDLSSTSPGHESAGSAPIESSNPSKYASRRRPADPETIRKVEEVVHQIVRSLQQEDNNLSIALRTRKRPGNSPPDSKSQLLGNGQYKLSFPGKTPEEAWRFSTAGLTETVCSRTSSMLTCSPAVILRILELIHEALVSNAVVSKRNIYYKDPELFKSQKIVDRYIDILSYTFGIQRAALNVAMLIEDVDDIRSIDILNVRWILMVEKESTFRTLDASKIYETSRAGKGIILTAKGYPDVSTRVFLRLLSSSSYPLPSIYAMVDFDPDGISIMSTYKHGSLTLSHENANLRCPIVRWLGVKSGDLDFRESTTAPPGASGEEDMKGLLRLTKRDRKKAVKMLGQGICEEYGVEQEWRRELQVMLMLNVKVEMEILSQREGDVEGWVEDRLCEEMS